MQETKTGQMTRPHSSKFATRVLLLVSSLRFFDIILKINMSVTTKELNIFLGSVRHEIWPIRICYLYSDFRAWREPL